jgi:membrane protease YdiL (CAAX protease family)
MAAVIAGVVEEAAFRGHMQVPLEIRYGLWGTIVIAIMFALAHLSHGFRYTVQLIPFYLVDQPCTACWPTEQDQYSQA